MKLWTSIVGKLWTTIILLVALVLLIVGFFLIGYIDMVNFKNESDVLKLFVITGLIGFALTTFFAFFLSFRITRPLLRMKAAASKVSEGDYSVRLPVRSADEIGELSTTFNDMAAQLGKMIEALNHEKEQLSNVLRSMTDAVITCDADGLVILSNPRGKQLLTDWASFEWGESDEHATRFNRVPLPLLEPLRQVVRDANDCATKIHVHQNVYSILMTPLYSENIVRGVVAVLRDISEEHRVEKMRRDFVANVSHELRTPLAMLQGYSEALLDDIADSVEERKELAKVIFDESLRMGRLVNNLLDLAKMEAGTFTMQFGALDFQPFLQRIVRKFSNMSRDKGVEIYTEIATGTSTMLTDADEDRLEQVMTNLIDNALRHSESGKRILIQVRNESTLLHVSIIDQGEGIPAVDVPFIFDRFYKADKARTRGHSIGTGLGLAIVKNIVEAHRGTIRVTSEQGKGTTFAFELPL